MLVIHSGRDYRLTESQGLGVFNTYVSPLSPALLVLKRERTDCKGSISQVVSSTLRVRTTGFSSLRTLSGGTRRC